MNELPSALERISVIMPTYNSMGTVDRAIDSVLTQTYPEWQLIAVDDGSTDATAQRIEERRRGRENKISLIHFAENMGPAAARNRGLAASDGEWIAFLDADDAWRENRLELLLEKAKQAGADGVCDNLLGFDHHLKIETGPVFSELPQWLDIVTVVAPTYAGGYNLGYLKPIVRRSFIRRNSIRYDENVRTGEDLLFLLNLLVHHAKMLCVDTPLYVYTTQVGSTSRKLSTNTKSAPRDTQLAHSLALLRDSNPAILSEQYRHAIDARIAYLRDIAPIAEFHHARLARKWSHVLRLILTSSAVRRKIIKTILWGS